MHHDTLKHLLRRTRVKTSIGPVHVRIYIYKICMPISSEFTTYTHSSYSMYALDIVDGALTT